LEQFRLKWLEEPLRADLPWETWDKLKAVTCLPLAAGENMLGFDAFDRALVARVLSVVQPDLAKWGGISGCRRLASRIADADAVYCPHYLGGGIGLAASAHLLAAAGGSGRLEVDANSNPLRTMLCGPINDVDNGWVTLGNAPALGIEPDLSALSRFLVRH
jgi:D-galactarolactone cycloisomerase